MMRNLILILRLFAFQIELPNGLHHFLNFLKFPLILLILILAILL